MDYKSKPSEVSKKYEIKFDDYRVIDEKEKEKNVNENLSKLPLHELLQQIK